MTEPLLRMWTVYEHPADYPEGYVAREWVVTDEGDRATATAFYSETLDEIQGFFIEHYPQLVFMPRFENDEPHILGTWL